MLISLKINGYIQRTDGIGPESTEFSPTAFKGRSTGFKTLPNGERRSKVWRSESRAGSVIWLMRPTTMLSSVLYEPPFCRRVLIGIWPLQRNDLPAAFGISHWPDSVRGTDLSAHSAANTGFRDTLRLPITSRSPSFCRSAAMLVPFEATAADMAPKAHVATQAPQPRCRKRNRILFSRAGHLP